MDRPMVSESAHARARAVLLVATAAPAGVLLRVAISERFRADGGASETGAVSQALAPNVIGAILLGVLDTVSPYTPTCLRIGLSSGFCASLTTFAAVIFHSTLLFINGNVGRGLTSLLISILLPPVTYAISCDIASLFLPNNVDEARWRMRQWVATILCTLGCGLVISLLVVCTVLFPSVLSRAVLLSPFGALLRYLLSIKLNNNSDDSWYRALPLGTLIANLLACLVDASLAALRYRNVRAAGWLLAARIGFASSLSTVSAFAAELVHLPKASRLFYATISITVGIVIVVIIYGSVVWASN